MNETSVYLELEYDIKKDRVKIASTNIKEGKICEILDEWIRNQMGEGNDERKPNMREVYHIRIEIDLGDRDKIVTYSDTGNASLTAGLVIATKKQLGERYQPR